jgi:hypothetical protein
VSTPAESSGRELTCLAGLTASRRLSVCPINLWPAVRIELGQEGWLKQPVTKVRGPIMAGDQGLRRGHQEIPVPEVWVHTAAARQEANGSPTGPVRLCSGVRMQKLHKSCYINARTVYFILFH